MSAIGRVKSVDLDLSLSGEGTGAAIGLVQTYAGTRPVAVYGLCALPTFVDGRADA